MVNGEPGPTRAYRRQVVDRPAIPQVNMVVDPEVRLHIEEEPMLGNGDGGQCAGGTLFTGNHHGTAKLVRQSSLNSISHQRQVQLTLIRTAALAARSGSTVDPDGRHGSPAQMRSVRVAVHLMESACLRRSFRFSIVHKLNST